MYSKGSVVLSHILYSFVFCKKRHENQNLNSIFAAGMNDDMGLEALGFHSPRDFLLL